MVVDAGRARRIVLRKGLRIPIARFLTVSEYLRNVGIILQRLGGFLCLETPHAAEIRRSLREEFDVFTDSRGTVLRLGPAPYVSDDQLDRAIEALGEVVRAIASVPAPEPAPTGA